MDVSLPGVVCLNRTLAHAQTTSLVSLSLSASSFSILYLQILVYILPNPAILKYQVMILSYLVFYFVEAYYSETSY